MTSSSRKSLSQYGAVTLFTTVILLLVSSIILVFAANYAIMQGKATANASRNQEAFQAAEAGMEFGINYFKQNATAITGTPVGGYIPAYSNASVTNVSLANNSRFSIVYSNPTANNYSLIKISSTGTSADSSATKTISQNIQRGSLLLNPGTKALATKGSVTMSGNSEVNNPANPITIAAAGAVSMSGNGNTSSSTASSSPGHINADIQQNNSTLANTSQANFINSFFGTSSFSTIQSKVEHTYTNSSSTNYSSTLNGMTGTSIVINQTDGTASINGNTTIGTPTSPVLLIVNGGLSLSGNLTFYGFIFIIGTSGITSTTGNVTINGAIASVDDLTMSGNSELNFNQSVLTNVQNLSSTSYYAKVPGSWKDF